jgi:two-component system, sensor histidine kinase and response regulator
MVAVDFNRFSQVLRNIISNALKFTSSGGVIDVRVTDHATRAMRTASLSTSTESHCATPKESTEFIRIDISDTGIGMTKEQQESLFKGVVQFADTTAANSNGAGLGLWSKPSPPPLPPPTPPVLSPLLTLVSAVSKSIVDLHNGMLLVSSDGIPGKGCVFSVLIRKTQLSSDLPLFISSSIANSQHQSMIDEELDLEANHENESHSQAAADVVPEESHTGNSFTWNSKTNRIQPLDSLKSKASPRESDYAHSLSRVHLSDTDSGAHPTAGITGGGAGFFPRVALCVDDSVLNRKLIGRYLEQHFEVLYAVNGLNAVEIVKNSLAEENEIDVIFMDNLMPVMDGLEATHQIRELGFKGPIIGITGNCEPEQIDEFIGQGANTVIHKPIQLDHFRKVILGMILHPLPLSLLRHSSPFSPAQM